MEEYINNVETTSQPMENKMGVLPEGKLLWNMGVPLSLSMLMQALYNIVDSIFVSYMGEDALTAVSLAYPMYMLMIAVAVGTGVGVNSLISRRLGARRFEDANHAATNGLLLMVISACVFVVFGIFGARPFMGAYTQNPQVLEMGTTYLSIVCTYCIGLFLQVLCERIMQSQGKNLYAMLMQLVGAVLNIIFDPILIFGLLGFPKLGIAGAAIATVGGQIVGMLFSMMMVFSKNSEVRLRLSGFRPDRKIIGEIYQVGLPAVIMQGIGTVMNLVMNAILIVFTETAVAVFGVYFKVQSVALMPLFGVTNAAMSIEAYNYGAHNKKRLMRTWRLTMRAGFIMMVLMTAVFVLFPDEILSLFNASPDMLRIGRAALTIMPLCLPVAALSISMSVVFQAVGNGLYSMFLSLARQLIVLIPAAWILAKVTGDVTAVWWSFPIAEVAGLILCVFFFYRTYKNRIEQLKIPA
jgi:putative MATE family efflux protein